MFHRNNSCIETLNCLHLNNQLIRSTETIVVLKHFYGCNAPFFGFSSTETIVVLKQNKISNKLSDFGCSTETIVVLKRINSGSFERYLQVPPKQ